MKALSSSEAPGKVYELGGAEIYSYRGLLDLVLDHAGIRRPLLPVPFAVWDILAAVSALLPTPPITKAQVTLMQQDNVVGKSVGTLRDLELYGVDLLMRPTEMASDKAALESAVDDRGESTLLGNLDGRGSDFIRTTSPVERANVQHGQLAIEQCRHFARDRVRIPKQGVAMLRTQLPELVRLRRRTRLSGQERRVPRCGRPVCCGDMPAARRVLSERRHVHRDSRGRLRWSVPR